MEPSKDSLRACHEIFHTRLAICLESGEPYYQSSKLATEDVKMHLSRYGYKYDYVKKVLLQIRDPNKEF